MKHNLHGDVSEDDLEVAHELLEMEADFDANLDSFKPSIVARVFVCLSHDWYELGDDDKGGELLQKADKVCPGYFDNEIKADIDKDSDFARLVESLTAQILEVAHSIMDQGD